VTGLASKQVRALACRAYRREFHTLCPTEHEKLLPIDYNLKNRTVILGNEEGINTQVTTKTFNRSHRYKGAKHLRALKVSDYFMETGLRG